MSSQTFESLFFVGDKFINDERYWGASFDENNLTVTVFATQPFEIPEAWHRFTVDWEILTEDDVRVTDVVSTADKDGLNAAIREANVYYAQKGLQVFLSLSYSGHGYCVTAFTDDGTLHDIAPSLEKYRGSLSVLQVGKLF